jgi:chromosome segregation ATPase
MLYIAFSLVLVLGAAVVLLYIRVIGLEEASGVYRKEFEKVFAYDNSKAKSKINQIEQDVREIQESLKSKSSAYSLQSLKSRVDSAENAIASLRISMGAVNSVSYDLSSIESDVDSIESDVNSLEFDLNSVKNDLDDLEDSIGKIIDAISDLNQKRIVDETFISNHEAAILNLKKNIVALNDKIDKIYNDADSAFKNIIKAVELLSGRINNIENYLRNY